MKYFSNLCKLVCISGSCGSSSSPADCVCENSDFRGFKVFQTEYKCRDFCQPPSKCHRIQNGPSELLDPDNLIDREDLLCNFYCSPMALQSINCASYIGMRLLRVCNFVSVLMFVIAYTANSHL